MDGGTEGRSGVTPPPFSGPGMLFLLFAPLPAFSFVCPLFLGPSSSKDREQGGRGRRWEHPPQTNTHLVFPLQTLKRPHPLHFLTIAAHTHSLREERRSVCPPPQNSGYTVVFLLNVCGGRVRLCRAPPLHPPFPLLFSFYLLYLVRTFGRRFPRAPLRSGGREEC